MVLAEILGAICLRLVLSRRRLHNLDGSMTTLKRTSDDIGSFFEEGRKLRLFVLFGKKQEGSYVLFLTRDKKGLLESYARRTKKSSVCLPSKPAKEGDCIET